MSEGEERDGREEGGKGGNREKIGVHVWQGVREGDVKWVERERGGRMGQRWSMIR